MGNDLSMEKFLGYLITLHKDYMRLAELLEKKREAVVLYDIDALDDIMKDEQAYVLLSKGFNTNIAAFTSALGLSGVTLSEVISGMPPEWQTKFTEAFTPLKEAIDLAKERNEACQQEIEKKMSGLRGRIEKLGGTENKVYGEARQAARKIMPGTFNKSI